MARGWESKSVESQQDDARGARSGRRGATGRPKRATARSGGRMLELALARTQADLHGRLPPRASRYAAAQARSLESRAWHACSVFVMLFLSGPAAPSLPPTSPVPPVRLFIGNLPYQATEDDLRQHFAHVGEPTQIVRPLDRETGRARGFAFVEYAERSQAEAAIQQFDGQLFMGRPLAVSEARAREDRGPGGPPRPGGSFGGPRPGGFSGPAARRASRRPRRPAARRYGRRLWRTARPGGGFGGPRPGGYGAPGPVAGRGRRRATRRERNFGPPAPPKGKKGKGNFQQKERGPKGPIPTKFTGRMYDLDEVGCSPRTASTKSGIHEARIRRAGRRDATAVNKPDTSPTKRPDPTRNRRLASGAKNAPLITH